MVDKYVHKGSQLYIEGSLRTREWTDKDNQKRYTTEIVATDMKLLGRRSDAQATPQVANDYSAQPAYQAPAQPAYQAPVQQPVYQQPAPQPTPAPAPAPAVGFESPSIFTTLLLILFKSTPRFSRTRAATPSPSLIKPRSRCSVPI